MKIFIVFTVNKKKNKKKKLVTSQDIWDFCLKKSVIYGASIKLVKSVEENVEKI